MQGVEPDNMGRLIHVCHLWTDKVEKLRSWGIGCDCHEEYRMKGKRVSCHPAGCRLSGAIIEVIAAVSDIKDLLEVLRIKAAMIGGDSELLFSCKLLLRRVLAEAVARTRLIHQLPYRVANLDRADVAVDIINQWQSIPDDKQHRVTGIVMARWGQHIKANTDGANGALPLEFASELRVWRRMPLASDLAEGTTEAQGSPK